MNQNASRQTAQEAVDQLIAAFSSHDAERYFAAFDEQATFLFHNLDRMLKSRAEYEAVWKAWEDEDQFRVLACRSTNGHLQLIGDVAIFTHNVSTDVTIQGQKRAAANAKQSFWLGKAQGAGSAFTNTCRNANKRLKDLRSLLVNHCRDTRSHTGR